LNLFQSETVNVVKPNQAESSFRYRIIGLDQKEYGPVTADQLRQWLAEDRVNGNTPVQLEGSADWKSLSSLTEFSDTVTRPSLTSPLQPAAEGNASLGSIKVFGLLNIIWGSLGLVSLPFTFFQIPLVATRLGYQPFMKDWLVFSSIISLAGSVLLIVSGLGLRRFQSWARKLAVYYSGLACVLTVASVAVTIRGIATNVLLPESERSSAIVAKAVGAALALAYYILLIVFLRRKRVKEALGETL